MKTPKGKGKGKEQKHSPELVSQSLTLGEYARSIIEEQYHSIIKRERKVIADEDPDHLHQMRVGTRRLRTALQVFAGAIAIPKVADEKQVGNLARILGSLRDLDVQIADLQMIYRPQVKAAEQKHLDQLIKSLKKQRQQAYANVKDTLEGARYQTLKKAYEDWLKDPQLTAIAQLPIYAVLPDLLSPLVSNLLLHAGWMVPASYSTEAEGFELHELRKAFKRVRYQTEFFVSFYGESFKAWVKEIKQLQENLGKLQDSHVLQELLNEHLPKKTELPSLNARIRQTRTDALSDWDNTRQRYLDPTSRRRLYQILLEPIANTSSKDEEPSNADSNQSLEATNFFNSASTPPNGAQK